MALPFLLRGAATEERSNRKGHFSSIAALLYCGTLLLWREVKERRNRRAIAAATTRRTSCRTSQNRAGIQAHTTRKSRVIFKVFWNQLCWNKPSLNMRLNGKNLALKFGQHHCCYPVEGKRGHWTPKFCVYVNPQIALFASCYNYADPFQVDNV